MIKRILLENFQSHKSTRLNLDPGVNVILGSSDSGKTAILRALDWAINNQPSGDAFRSNWGGETSVDVDIGGTQVERTKGKSTNEYALITGPDERETFTAFGQGVPPEIDEALNLYPINWQRQHDAPFLLSSTPGQVARHFNEFADLAVIDKAIAHSAKAVREQRRELDRLDADIDEVESDLERFVGLDELAGAVTALAQREKGLRAERRQVTEIKKLITEAKAAQDDVAEYARVDEFSEKVDELLEAASELEEGRSITDEMCSALEAIDSCQDEIAANKKRLVDAEKKYDEMMPDVCPLCEQEVKK